MTAALPYLPQAWIDGMQKGEYIARPRGKVSGTKAAWKWLQSRPDPKGAPCPVMQNALDNGLKNLEESSGGAAHDELNRRIYELISLAVEGHKGVRTAVVALGEAFIYEVAERRRSAVLAGDAAGTVRAPEEARREVGRSIVGRVELMVGSLAEGEAAATCACWIVPGEEPSRARDPFQYELTDTGNAEQLIDLADGKLLWVPAYAAWFGWNEELKLWEQPKASAGAQWARKIAPRVKIAAEQRYKAAETAAVASSKGGKSDAEILIIQAKKLQQWAEKCGSAAAIANMQKLASDYPEMVADAESFDTDSKLLHCGDGQVLHLTSEGAVARPGTIEDRISLSTGVPYVAGATDPLWKDYLDTFIPDLELRWFVQRLLGYSLLGSNPERLLCFFHGPTSSGKTTLLENVGKALGGYAGTFNLSVFRSKQDEGPRPDLVRVVAQRVAFASEAGSEWHLHTDDLKKLTGGDTVTARTLNSRVFVTRVPAFTPFIATNDVPTIKSADAALWRRLVVVPFDHQVKNDQPDLMRDSPASQIAILNWLIEGYNGYAKEGIGKHPKAVVERTAQFRGEVSETHLWMHEACVLDPEAWFVASEVHNSYLSWAARHGVAKPLNTTMFGKFLSAQDMKKPMTHLDPRDGKRKAMRRGLRLKRSNPST